MDSLRIVFMGTPSFAVYSLQMIVDSGLNVVAVVTAPDRPQGRGQKPKASPVKCYAMENNLPVLQPANLKSPAFLTALADFAADVHVVVAFRMLPKAIWAMPPMGTFNLHASLLPHYRGAAPIPWAIINGERETGVTTFFIDHEIDTGRIIFQHKVPIRNSDDAGTLHDRLMVEGAKLVLKTLKAITAGKCPATPQRKGMLPLKKAPKLFKSSCRIDWNQSTTKVFNFIRGLSPFPGAWTTIDNQPFKVLKASISTACFDAALPGEWASDNKSYLRCRAADGWIDVLVLQKAGKKQMTVEEFFRGNKIDI